MILGYYLALVFWSPARILSSSVHSTLKRWIKEIIQENWTRSLLVLNKFMYFLFASVFEELEGMLSVDILLKSQQ